jgi:hypothetical protein
VNDGDVLYPYSSVFLAALPEAGRARGLPRGQAQSLLAAVDGLDFPVGALYVAVPVGATEVRLSDFRAPARSFEVAPFRSWLLVRAGAFFQTEAAVLQAAARSLRDVRVALVEPVPEPLDGWFELNSTVLCEALSSLGAECVSE